MGKRVAIIGAGISGLTAAYRVLQAGFEPVLFEASDRVGGVIHTTHAHDCLLELGPDCWASNKPAAMELVTELGLEGEIQGTKPGTRRSFILHKGKLKRLPQGFFLIAPMSIPALIKTPIISWCGKIRMAFELFKRRRKTPSDESLSHFVKRRFGQEALDRIAQPMVSGIYTADPDKLSLQATFPQFLEWEQSEGSVIRALRKKARKEKKSRTQTGGEIKAAAGPRYGLFVTLKPGMETLPNALHSRLPDDSVRLNTPIKSITPSADGVTIETENGPENFDAAILAVPANVSGKLLSASHTEAAEGLQAIEYAGAVVANFVFKRDQIAHPLDGIGAVVPAIEGRNLVAVSFSHQKFEGRAPDGTAIIRVFMGGALQPELALKPIDELTAIALKEARDILGITGEPLGSTVSQHRGRMAQYHVGHKERTAKLRELLGDIPRLKVIGNGFDGVGIPDCIRNANEATTSLIKELT
ncbi:protoporphyrinogen oxidase [Planctomycetota bacterium]|nr:protoporphyrinogen oxidase [Planctomycetota bacterium]